jgi:hypothetical protein
MFTNDFLQIVGFIHSLWIEQSMFTKCEFFIPCSFNISMSNMVIMHIWHLKLIWETLCWFAHLDVKWTIYHLTIENLFDMLMSICTMCADVKWTTCSLNMNFLSMSIQHVLTFDKMSNKHVEWTSFLYLCQKGCIIGDSTFQTAKIAKSRILKSKFWKWRSNFGFFLLPKVRKKIVKKHQIGQLVFSV